LNSCKVLQIEFFSAVARRWRITGVFHQIWHGTMVEAVALRRSGTGRRQRRRS
jgi:hypothetical protein